MNWDHKELKATAKTSGIIRFLDCQARLEVPGAEAYLEFLSEDHRSWGNMVMPLCSLSSRDLLCFVRFLLWRMHVFMLICQLIGVPKCVCSLENSPYLWFGQLNVHKKPILSLFHVLCYTAFFFKSSSNLKWSHAHCGLKCPVALPVFKDCHIFFPLSVAGMIVTSGANLWASRIAGP